MGIQQKQPSRVFLGKVVLKICSKFTRKHQCQSASLINRTSAWVFHKFAAYFQNTFFKNTSRQLLLVQAIHALSICTMIEASKRKAKELICMLQKLNEMQKNFMKIFTIFLKKSGGIGVETKCHMTFVWQKIEL